MSARDYRYSARVALCVLALAACATATAPVSNGAPAVQPDGPPHGVAAAPGELPPPPDICAALPEESTAKVAHIDGFPEDAPPKLQLPEDARPTQEALSLNIDPTQTRFSGTAAIAVQLDKPRSVIWLHGRGLHVTEAHLDLEGGRLPVDYQQVNEWGLVRARLPCLVSGRALLSITWDAPYNEQLAGIYLAREDDIPYAYTQFEAIDARQAFPGFDEPAFKIPWDIELVVPSADVAISNGSIASESLSEGTSRRIRFTTTKPLPTYLLAFAVGPFDVVVPKPLPPNEVRDHPLQVRGIAPKGRGPELQFAMEASAALLPRLESWFGIPYPYEKLDQIAVPDFTYGAMENAGAITYRESVLLYKQGISGAADQEHIAVDMSHEMAHQWFGDLVTLRWWTDAWLNESFAAWMESRPIEEWRPDLRAAIDHLGDVQEAMKADGNAAARAIRKPVEDEASIWNQFDDLTYSKGAGLLSMMESWLGPEPFRKGIQSYLRAHANGSGSSDDLLASMSAAAGHDVAGPMRSFLEQAGVPLIKAKLVCNGKVRVLLEQSRDLPQGLESSEAMRAQRWQVPVCIRASIHGESRSACTLLTEQKGEIDLGGARCPDWVMPNAGGVGYYRFSLEPNDLEALLHARAQLTTAERVSLTTNLGRGFSQGTEPAAEMLHALSLFARDPEPLVSKVLTEVLYDARANLIEPRFYPALEAYARANYQPLAARLGWTERDSDSPATKAERAEVLTFLADTARDPAVRKAGAKLGRAYANLDQDSFAPGVVAPDLSGLALALAVQEGPASMRQKLIVRLANSNDAAIRGRILAALESSRDPAVTNELLQLSLDPQLHKNERVWPAFMQLSHPETRAAALIWLVAHWDALAAQVPETAMAYIVRTVAAIGCQRETIATADAFLRPRAAKIASAELDLEQGLESARRCVARRESQEKSLEAFFSRAPIKH